ncbi:MAG TPA: MBL fold metallo-hydrolase [Dehalococcoidia bacterium]|nr:MBL fold metallo-hydrolase [Dehalococcoidia bacterium]
MKRSFPHLRRASQPLSAETDIVRRLLSCLLLSLVVLGLACSNSPAAKAPTSSQEEEASEASGASPSSADGTGSLTPVAAIVGRLDVYFFDVSLGDAIYIRTPTGEDVVIDGGDSRNELSTFLDQLGETAIDVVVASHPHADHIGGLPRLVNERQVGQVWDNGEPYTTQVFKDLASAIAGKGVPEHSGKVGDSFTVGGVKFTVLGPLSIGRNINDNSLVIRADCGSSSFLFAGDAEFDSDSKMVASGEDLDVDVLKLGHHGSRTSTSTQLIAATTPRLAIYQARVGNQFGHPHQETLDRLAAAHVPTFGTGAAGGTVVVSTACDDVFSVSPHFDGFADVLAAVPQLGVALPPAATEATQPTVPPPQPTVAPLSSGNCDPSYPDVCIPPAPPDLDCKDVPFKRFRVLPPDPHRFDADHDGIGCES